MSYIEGSRAEFAALIRQVFVDLVNQLLVAVDLHPCHMVNEGCA
jgi:hypothetical protein